MAPATAARLRLAGEACGSVRLSHSAHAVRGGSGGAVGLQRGGLQRRDCSGGGAASAHPSRPIHRPCGGGGSAVGGGGGVCTCQLRQ